MISRDKNKFLIKYDLEKFIDEKDLGEVQNIIKLKKQGAASSKNNTDAFLLQTIRGVWIIDTEKQNSEYLIDLWESDDLKYHSKMTGDLIEVSGQTFKFRLEMAVRLRVHWPWAKYLTDTTSQVIHSTRQSLKVALLKNPICYGMSGYKQR